MSERGAGVNDGTGRVAGRLRVPAVLAVLVVAGLGEGCPSSPVTREEIGDGCAQFRARDAAITQIECRLDGGCLRFTTPEGAFVQLVCPDPRDFECRTTTEADGAVETLC